MKTRVIFVENLSYILQHTKSTKRSTAVRTVDLSMCTKDTESTAAHLGCGSGPVGEVLSGTFPASGEVFLRN
jgi:hypothetical protein